MMAPELLTFEIDLPMEEDYDLLLRICAAYPADFERLAMQIGDYYYKTDGSNTVPTQGGLTGDRLLAYNSVLSRIEARRRTTLVAPSVQRNLGLHSPMSGLTIRAALNMLRPA
jgi:hypothetical protein